MPREGSKQRQTMYKIYITLLFALYSLTALASSSLNTTNATSSQQENKAWDKAPYIGFQYGVASLVSVGYGKKFGIDRNYYFSGETFVVLNYLGNPIGAGASINPGILLTPSTLAYGRVGGVKSRESDGLVLGLGIQTNIVKNLDFRGEVNNALIQIGIIYKL